MIQLATDPNASRSNWRPAAEAKESNLAPRRRTGHSWPFLVRHADRPAQQDRQRSPNTESGS